MPIYAYKCESCGFAKDVLQKTSDPLLDVCPSCNQPTFKKQVTAAGFQLKGSGWYVTDFKASGSAPAVAPKTDSAESATTSVSATDSTSATPPAVPSTGSTPTGTAAVAPASSAPVTPAASGG
jgi:putative FmdB family regulatory protein